MSSIMHYKYIVKDVNQGDGYLFIGSPNISHNAFITNYEDMVFTSSQEVVSAFHSNFQACWDYVKTENKTMENKVKLAEADFT